MKVLALVYPGMTLLDLVGPLQAWSFLPGYEVQYAWHRAGSVPTDCGLSVQATHSFEVGPAICDGKALGGKQILVNDPSGNPVELFESSGE